MPRLRDFVSADHVMRRGKAAVVSASRTAFFHETMMRYCCFPTHRSLRLVYHNRVLTIDGDIFQRDRAHSGVSWAK